MDHTEEAESLASPERDRVTALCRRFDFPVARVGEDGDVLVLVPRTIEEIPDSDRLGELAHRLSEEGFHHVAFSIRADEGS